ncbi:MAG: DUF5723 family protein [Chitinophagales bacterium]|nr:DUF5723 family protein [Chitinophagales bacterium]MDW8428779.1 DUF5723 family protein [Chitinophagales bacterium]
MKKLGSWWWFATCLLFTWQVQAQLDNPLVHYNPTPTETGVALARDYQTAGINPANLGIYPRDYDVPLVTFGVAEASGMFFSDALTKEELWPSLLRLRQLTSDERRDLAQQFATDGHLMTASLLPFALCVQFPKFLGASFSWQERVTGQAVLSSPFADLLFNGLQSTYLDTLIVDLSGSTFGLTDSAYNYYELFNGSSIHYNWLRDYALSAGMPLFTGSVVALYAGASIKFVQSNAYLNLHFSEDTLTGLAAFSSLFNIDYANLTDPDVQLGGRFAPIGKGTAYDVGLTLRLGKSLFVATAITDIGKITYTGNLVTISEALTDTLVNYLGLNYATLFSDFKNIFNAKGLFTYLPRTSYTTSLPSTLRLGAAWHMSHDVRLAFTMMVPVSESVAYWATPRFSSSLEMLVTPNLKLSAGVQFDKREVLNIPAGIVLSLTPSGIWQLSMGTGDLVSLVRQNRPTLSARLALLRFHFR